MRSDFELVEDVGSDEVSESVVTLSGKEDGKEGERQGEKESEGQPASSRTETV